MSASETSSKGALSTRIDKYAIACAAAAAGAAVCHSTDANAAIVYSGAINRTVPIAFTGTTSTYGYAYVDLFNGTATVNAAFTGTAYQLLLIDRNRNTGPKDTGFFTKNTTAVDQVAPNTTSNITAKLTAGTTVGTSSVFGTSYASGANYQYNFISYDSAENTSVGFPWVGGASDGYVGLRLPRADGTHYAWVHLTISDFNSGEVITINDFAYQTTPGVAIVTGQVPEPASMALAVLALGAVGIRPKRKEQAAA